LSTAVVPQVPVESTHTSENIRRELLELMVWSIRPFSEGISAHAASEATVFGRPVAFTRANAADAVTPPTFAL
jgi:hypothetical protein